MNNSQPATHDLLSALRAVLISLIFLVLQIGLMSSLAAQNFKFGPRIGIASSPLVVQDIQNLQEVAISFQDGSPEYQVGVFARIQALGIFLQPELLFTTASGSFLVEDLKNGGTEIFKEQYYHVELPVMAGIKLGPIRFQGGPVYRMNLGNRSDFFSAEGFSRRFTSSQVGLQTGVGLDIGKKLVFDLKYELPLNQVSDEITIFGSTHNLSNRGTHLVASMGISF